MTFGYGGSWQILWGLGGLLACAALAGWLLAKHPWATWRAAAIPPAASRDFDRLRALMAVLVLLEHLRLLMWVDYAQVRSPTLLVQAIYFVTAWGTQAVTVFFVLSGYLITRRYLVPLLAGRVRWPSFALGRATRLYLVLVPALLLTGALAWTRGQPAPLAHLLGQLAFIQPNWVPPFGGNRPLWSLGYEGQAYLSFSLLVMVGHAWMVERRTARRLAVPAGLLALQLLLFGSAFWHYLSLWLLGALAGVSVMLPRAGSDPEAGPRGSRAFVPWTTALVVAFVVSRFHMDFFLRNLLVAVPAAGLLRSWELGDAGTSNGAEPSQPARPFGAPASASLARSSYSLYVLHYPFLLTVIPLELGPTQPSVSGALAAGGLGLAALVMAGAFAQFTEKPTARVRRWLETRLGVE